MAVLHLDQNVSSQFGPLLRVAGHDVIETRAIGRPRATDDELLLFAANARRIFVTHNEKDFILLHDAWRRWSSAWGVAVFHAGILVLPQPPRLTIERAATELDRFLATEPQLASTLYFYRPTGGWRPHS